MVHPTIQGIQERVNGLNNGTQESTRGVRRAFSKANYTGIRISSSRPSSGRGVTFHFKHSFVSKGKHESGSNHEYTTAAKHQAYIERERAVGVEDTEQLYTNLPPGMIQQPGKDSFGTIGDHKAEREEFWRKIERAEGRKGRVQSRMIVELPHECTDKGRRQIAQQFCQTLHDKQLPFWCSIHVPYGENDPRNYHMHILYHDRPARKIGAQWDFDIQEKRQYSNRTYYDARPYRQPKDRTAQGKDWITQLRTDFAQAANAVLEQEGIDKRYDPRPYQESGITKSPTIHVGTNASAAERKGISTRKGDTNTEREISWRMQATTSMAEADTQWVRSIETDQPQAKGIDRLFHVMEQRRKAMEEAETLRIQAEATTNRIAQRERFVEEEIIRMSRPTSAPGIDPHHKEAGLHRLHMEHTIIQEAKPAITDITSTYQTMMKEKQQEVHQYDDFLNKERTRLTADNGHNDDNTHDNTPTIDNEFDEVVQDISTDVVNTPAQKRRNTRRRTKTHTR